MVSNQVFMALVLHVVGITLFRLPSGLPSIPVGSRGVLEAERRGHPVSEEGLLFVTGRRWWKAT